MIAISESNITGYFPKKKTREFWKPGTPNRRIRDLIEQDEDAGSNVMGRVGESIWPYKVILLINLHLLMNGIWPHFSTFKCCK
jgi:hypothetical protein